jgi:hypothetical protein
MNVVDAATHAVSEALTLIPEEADGPCGGLEQPAAPSVNIDPMPAMASSRRETMGTEPTVEQPCE